MSGEEREAGSAAEEFGEEAVAKGVGQQGGGPVEVPFRAWRGWWFRTGDEGGGDAGAADRPAGGGGAEGVAGGDAVGGGVAPDVESVEVGGCEAELRVAFAVPADDASIRLQRGRAR